MKPSILAAVIMGGFAAPAAAQELCIEPIRPEAAHLLDAGFSGAEVRSEFRRYFSEVEDYLNCLNETSGRIRADARAAAYEYRHVLETTDPDEGKLDTDILYSSEVMKETGELFLDYMPNKK